MSRYTTVTHILYYKYNTSHSLNLVMYNALRLLGPNYYNIFYNFLFDCFSLRSYFLFRDNNLTDDGDLTYDIS